MVYPTWQIPPLHGPIVQRFPHVPQLLLSVLLLTSHPSASKPSQSRNPC